MEKKCFWKKLVNIHVLLLTLWSWLQLFARKADVKMSYKLFLCCNPQKKFRSTRSVEKSTGIRLTSSWIRCFNSWTVWGAGALKTWDFRYRQRKKSHAGRSGDPAGHVMSPSLEITWLGNKFLPAAMESCAVWLIAPSCWKKRFFGYWMTSKLRT